MAGRTTVQTANWAAKRPESGPEAAQRANRIWKQRLADYEPPPIDPANDEELQDYVDRRKAELPDEFA